MSYYSYDTSKPVVANTATTYYMKFKPTGWAIFTVDNVYGSLSIISDWGNWSRLWSSDPKSLGAPDFNHFLSDAGIDYLAHKLIKGEYQELDVEATLLNIKKETLRSRRNREITQEMAEAIWEDLEAGDLFDENEILRVFTETQPYQDDAYFEYDTIVNCFEYGNTQEYKNLTELLLPALQTYLKANICATI